MDFYGIARQQVDTSMSDQFQYRETPEPDRDPDPDTPRRGILTAIRLHLSNDLRALAAVIEPSQPLTPKPGGSHR